MRLATFTDGARWHHVALLLSIEAADDFWPDMGWPLASSEHEALRPLVRTFVSQYRAIENDAAMDDAARLAALDQLVDQLLAWVEQASGPELAKAYTGFTDEIFQYGTDLDARLFLWRRLLSRFVGLHGASPPEEIAIDASRADALREVVARRLDDPKGLADRLNAARAMPSSEWQQRILSTYTAGADPLDWVENQIWFVRTQAAVEGIRGQLDPEERSAFMEWAHRQARAMHVPGDWVATPPTSDGQW